MTYTQTNYSQWLSGRDFLTLLLDWSLIRLPRLHYSRRGDGLSSVECQVLDYSRRGRLGGSEVECEKNTHGQIGKKRRSRLTEWIKPRVTFILMK